MKHVTIESFDIPDAWFKSVNTIWNQGEIFTIGHGSECTETKKLDVTVEIDHPENMPYVADKSPTDPKTVMEYALTYFWTDYLGDHPYTYGWRLRHPVDQIEYVIKAIIDNPNNRQFTMTIRIPEDVDNPEPPCLTMIDLEVMDNKINLTGYFRSWDSYGAMNDNLIGIFLLLDAITTEINERAGTNYKTGKMIIHSKNCHIYQRQYNLVKELLTSKTTRPIIKKPQKPKSKWSKILHLIFRKV